MNTQGFYVYPLRGIDQRWKPSENSASYIQDMTWVENEAWKECGGIRQVVPDDGGPNPFVGEGGIQSIHWFAQHNGAKQWLVWDTSQGKLRYFNGSAATPWSDVVDSEGNAFDAVSRTRSILNTAWQRTQSQAYAGRLYLINGLDEPLVFNGRYVERAGYDSPPPAPTASVLEEDNENWRTTTIDQGLGREAPDEEYIECGYRYIVSFVNERGQESPPSQPSEMIIFENGDGTSEKSSPHTGGRSFLQVQIPTGGPEVVARRIYRTRNILNSDGEPIDLGYGSDFYFLTEIQDNVVRTFEDMVPDIALGSLLEPLDFGVWPTSAKYLAMFKNTMFIAGMANNELRFSSPLYAEVFPQDNVFDVSDSNLGPITGMYATKNALVVFKSRGIYLVKGDSERGFYAETLTKDVGCIAPNTLRELPGIGICFLSHAGLYILAGALENTGTPTQVVNLSTNIPNLIGRISLSSAINSFGAVYHTGKEYWLAVPTLGSEHNNLVLVFHYEIGEWSVREGFPIGCMVETNDHRGYLMMGSNDLTNKPGVLVYSCGWPDKLNNELVDPRYDTADIEFGSVYTAVQPSHVIVYAVAHGNNDITLNYNVNQGLDYVRTTAQSQDQQNNQEVFPVYGSAVWGTDRWTKLRPTTIRFDISTTHVGPVRELNLSFGAENRRMQVIGFDLEAKVGEQRRMKPLYTALKPDKG